MKISKRDAQLLMGLIGIIAVIFSYQFVFTNLQTKDEATQKEIKILETRVDELEKIQANLDQYQTKTKEMNQEMTEFYSTFPADIRLEDRIMFVTNMENENDNMKISQISFGEAEQINAAASKETDTQTQTDTKAETMQAETQTETQTNTAKTLDQNTTEADNTVSVQEPVLYKVPVGLSLQVTYKGLKDMITYIYDNGQAMGMESVSVSYDNTTGVLIGSTMIDMYKVTGTNHVYTEPNVPSVTIGSDNIFGTIEAPIN